MPNLIAGLPAPVTNRDVRAIRNARRHNPIQCSLTKIIEMEAAIQTLRCELSLWTEYATHPTWNVGEWLRVPSCIVSGVAAMSDALYAHWADCQVRAFDSHLAGDNSVAPTTNMRGNVAKNSRLFIVQDFGSMTDAELRRLQRGRRRSSLLLLRSWRLVLPNHLMPFVSWELGVCSHHLIGALSSTGLSWPPSQPCMLFQTKASCKVNISIKFTLLGNGKVYLAHIGIRFTADSRRRCRNKNENKDCHNEQVKDVEAHCRPSCDIQCPRCKFAAGTVCWYGEHCQDHSAADGASMVYQCHRCGVQFPSGELLTKYIVDHLMRSLGAPPAVAAL
jgi:hypothetical protein